MEDGEELEKELEAEMRMARVPAFVRSHSKGCRSCLWQFSECTQGNLYRPQASKLARSPCRSWKSCGLESLPQG